MTIRFRLMAAAALGLAMSYPVMAVDSAPSSDVSTEIQALKTRLEQLEAKQKLAEVRRVDAEQKLEAKITSDELKHDAVQHDQLLTAEGFTAGYSDGRFVIQSNDGNFALRPWLHLQFRDVTEYRKDHTTVGTTHKHGVDETDNGFEVRRMRFGFDGNMWSPDFTYMVNWATVRNSGNQNVTGATAATTGGAVTTGNSLGGALLLEEAWVQYHIPTTGFSLKLGQIKDPVLHDQITSSRYQQSAERSLTADVFTNGDSFTEGATILWTSPHDIIHTEVGVNHGMRSANTNFLDYPNNSGYNQFDYGVAGRAEFKLMGRWKDYKQVGAVGTKQPLLVVGTGADYSERGHDGQLVAVGDIMYADQNGLSFYGAYVDRYTTHNFGAYTQSPTGASILTPDAKLAGKATNEYSLLGEAGYIIDHRIEPFGRYEMMHVLGDGASSRNWIQVVTFGVNYFFQGNKLKLTLEGIYLPKGLPFDDGPSDTLANKSGKTEFNFVAQLQWLL